MNCSDFRAKWLNHAYETDLSHIETCDDCLHWIETVLASGEEVQFMKEFPQPSADLEERIMQTIYAENGKAILPPLTAAEETPSDPAQRAENPWRRMIRNRWGAWIGAAAVLLVVSLMGIQGQFQNDMERAGSHSAAGAAQESIASSVEPSTPESSEKATTFTVLESPQSEASAATGTEDSAASPAQSLQAEQPNSPASDKQPKPEQEERNALEQTLIAMDTPNRPQVQPVARAHAETSLASRDATGLAESVTEQQKQAEAPEVGGQPSDTAMQAAEETDSISSASPRESDVVSMAGMDEVPTAAKTEHAASEGPKVAEMPLTISTFSDVTLAAQVSDIPVPVLVGLPDGFALQEISLRYPSETSKHVSAVTASYKRDDHLVSVAVTRNDSPQRSLSIPGTFVDRRLFPIGSDQAIAVTHDPKTAANRSEHEVHFLTTQESIPLYVTITGSGVSIDEVIHAARTIQWSQG